MKKYIALCMIVVILSTLMTGCGMKSPVGRWTTTIDGADGVLHLAYGGGGTLTSNDVERPVRWQAKDGKLTVIQTVNEFDYTFLDHVDYSVGLFKLTVTKGEKELVFTRK